MGSRQYKMDSQLPVNPLQFTITAVAALIHKQCICNLGCEPLTNTFTLFQMDVVGHTHLQDFQHTSVRNTQKAHPHSKEQTTEGY